jgi:integrase
MSVQKTKFGTYEVRFRDGIGRHRSRSFSKLADARTFERDVKTERQRRGITNPDRGKMTLAEFTQVYWDHNSPEWEETTKDHYRSVYERKIYNQLGGSELRSLSPAAILDWKAGIEGETGAATLIKTMAFLSGILSYAVQRDEIDHNPLREIKKPKQEIKLAPDPLSATDVELLRSILFEGNNPLRDTTLVSVLAYMGLRPGEALRLRWEDLGEQTARIVSGKTNRERPGLLVPTLREDLLRFKTESSGLIFDVDWRNWRKRVWQPAFKQAGLSGDSRPYRLRSTFVSLLLADPSYSIAEVSMYAGHSLEIMTKHYARIISEVQGRSVDFDKEIREARGL